MALGRMTIALAAVGLLAAAAPAPTPADPGAAKAFVASIYARYPSADGNPPLFGIQPKDARLVDPGLLALIREDERLGGDYEGELAYDPFCHCTHDNGMTAELGEPVAGPAGRVVVPVVVGLALPDQPPSTVRLRIAVVNNRGRLQVWDIEGEHGGVRAMLTAANRRRRLH